jgi:hypothetical protein
MTTMTGQARHEAPAGSHSPGPAPDLPPTAPGPQSQSGLTHRVRGKDPRSRDVRRFRAFMARMLRAYAARAAAEDPDVLADMIATRRLLDELIDQVGRSLVEQTSVAQVARELGVVEQVISKRWGNSAEAAARTARRSQP